MKPIRQTLSRSVFLVLSSVAALGLSGGAQAADLVSVWKAAQATSPGHKAAITEGQVGLARLEQAAALWNPQVSAQATVGVTSLYNSTRGAQFYSSEMGGAGPYEEAEFNTSVYLGATAKASLMAVAPIFDRSLQASAAQLRLSAEASSLAKAVSHQFLALAVAERYLDVLAAQEMVLLTSQQIGAVEKAYAELEKRLRLGDVSRIDLDESLERLQQLRAERIRRESDLVVANRALADLAGKEQSLSRPSFAADGLQRLQGLSFEELALQMRQVHPSLKVIDLRREIHLAEIEKFVEGRDGMRLHAVGAIDVSGTAGWGEYGDTSMRQISPFVGIQLSVPLDSGGMYSAKVREAASSAGKLVEERQQRALDLEQAMRAAWLSAQSTGARLALLRERIKTSEARLSATEKAYRLGARSTLELLAAQSSVYEARGQLYLERLSLARQFARLYAHGGLMDEAEMVEIAAYLR